MLINSLCVIFIGPSVIPGLLVVFALIPINYCIAKMKKKMQLQEMFHRDKCVKFIQDLLSGIKVDHLIIQLIKIILNILKLILK